MNLNMTDLYVLVTQSAGILILLAYAGGVATCLVHRRLSPWLFLVAGAFVGLSLGSITRQVTSLSLVPQPELIYSFFILASIIQVVSSLMLVFGLYLTLVQIRGKLALSMDPTHVPH